MKIETNSIDYGIYIDREKAFVIALDRVVHEALISTEILENPGKNASSENVSSQEHVQNKKNEMLGKFCKSIIEKVTDAHNIVVFGPSTSKFELQKEIRHAKRLKNVKEELVVTDFMDKNAALHFVKTYYTPIAAGPQIFTVRSRP